MVFLQACVDVSLLARTAQVIMWDLTRTFPAHDFFKAVEGQKLLYNVNKVRAGVSMCFNGCKSAESMCP